MNNKIKIVHYINQFFGQIGGEEKANIPPRTEDGPVGPGNAFNNALGEKAEIVKTIICGDSYFNENTEDAKKEIKKVLSEVKPDLVLAGPAFNAGRYGMACGGVAEIANEELDIPVISGLYPENPGYDMKKVTGGLLVQERDLESLNSENELKIVTEKSPTKNQIKDLLFSWKVVKHVKSNAIVMAKNKMLVGVGAGQMSRVDAMIIAGRKADGRQKDGIVASDAFFPFPDAVKKAAELGIKAIIQPGGSIRDEEVIKKAEELGIAMYFTNMRHFCH